MPLVIGVLVSLFRPGARAALSAALGLGLVYLAWSWTAKLVVEAHAREALAAAGVESKSIFAVPAPFNTLLWRFVAGAGSAMYMTGAQVYLIDISTPANRARVIAANQGALLLGVSIGPAVGGALAEWFGLRVPFFAVGAASLLTALYAFARLPEM